MAKCKDCKNSCYLLNEYDEPYFWCNVFEDNFDEEREVLCISYRQKTNADKIRSMTDEKLAEWLYEIIYKCGDNLFSCHETPINKCNDCKDCYLAWLKTEI